MSSIIVAAAALFTISAPIAAAKKDCREGTYYCGKDLLAIGNLLELFDATRPIQTLANTCWWRLRQELQVQHRPFAQRGWIGTVRHHEPRELEPVLL